MNIFERLWKDDLTQLDYLLTDKERTNYHKNKYM